ncbi:alpha/beta hydrolase [Aerolutibacter ruishenii]|uniref:Alpha/beta hydrolase family protein n=1 Tax=Aerolutibacter ruishenii TaxID=686800 RepID=A0A562M0I0_9GAMM|nr:alpha/beta hydrolase [Lysobacter ruishenii]TWI13426.1 alpha/beta hydrolase family protein [Lysobacter ruishenii]
MNARLTGTALGAALLLAACQPTGDTAPTAATADTAVHHLGQVTLQPCVLGGDNGLPTVEAQCGQFEVAENPAQPQGRRIKLNLARLPATGKGDAQPDPVFFLAGGPGQAATRLAPVVNAALREVRKQRDLILVDQRGTGDSNPLDCKDAKGAPLELDATRTPTDAELAGFARQCLASLAGRADPRFYTTTHAIADLEALRAAMGVDKINLVGGSYGTRVAQQYAMRHPAHTRTVVIDGVAPNRLVVGGEFARTLERALQLQQAQCAKLPQCQQRLGGDLVARLKALKDKLNAAPVEVAYRDPTTNEPRRDTLSGDLVAGLAQGVSYMPQVAAMLPLVVSEAEQGRYESLMAIARIWSGQVGGQMNRGMQWSVVCAEDAPRYRADPADDATVFGGGMGKLFFAACATWTKGEVPADFHAPFKSSLPTLLLSGELDPVTPPAYADEVAKGLGNARHLVLRGQAHGTMGTGCMPKLLSQFIESADPKALDTQCLDSLTYTPPFTSFNGWEP